MYSEQGHNNKILCTLCPNGCSIPEEGYGVCGIRTNKRGYLSLPYFGVLSGFSLDPIEKKPLYHYYPGYPIFSVGFYGCSLKCPFCQNYHISQNYGPPRDSTSPEETVSFALKYNSFGIAYTYSEPLIHFEFLMETATLARKKGLKNILVTNGYINEKPALELLPLIDAANVDLKSFNPDFYKKELKGKIEPVKRFIELSSKSIHLEVTTLIIPGKNDSDKEILGIAEFLAFLDREIPLHLSCYYPVFKYTLPPTPPGRVFSLAEIARKHLAYVYPGNVGVEEVNTYCPSCGNLLIKRTGYKISLSGLESGLCKKCSRPVKVVGA